jgi:2-keto-4-pentenoate hydratase/2-oxohepta-3-ene-1,7-dioic acid hydratase in catechol pathway
MQIITYHYNRQQCLAVKLGDRVVLPSLSGDWPADINSALALINRGTAMVARLQQLVDDAAPAYQTPFDPVLLAAPIPRARRNVICLGWNYADHAEESAAASKREYTLPEYPVVFTKSPTSITGPYTDIPFDANLSSQIDWEVELGVIIGAGGRGIKPENALRHVFGYTVMNDISARDIQSRHKQFFLGKSLDKSSPMGPSIVTADEIPDPQALWLRSWVNGVLKQESHTARQIFDVATTLSILSRGMSLEPGDIIATGTPSGVGFARKPPEFLGPGDVVECEVEEIGRLKNRIMQQ